MKAEAEAHHQSENAGFALCLPHYDCADYALGNIDVALKSRGVTEIVVVDDASPSREWEALRDGIHDRASHSQEEAPIAALDEVSVIHEIFTLAAADGRQITVRLSRFLKNRGPFYNKGRTIWLTSSPWALLLDPDNVVNVRSLDYLTGRSKVASMLYLPSGHYRFVEGQRPRLRMFPRILSWRDWNISEFAFLLASAGTSLRRQLHYFLNNGNFVCDVMFYKGLDLGLKKDPCSSDVITLVRLWLQAGGGLITDRKFKYWHRLRAASHWVRLGNVEETNAAIRAFNGSSPAGKNITVVERLMVGLYAAFFGLVSLPLDALRKAKPRLKSSPAPSQNSGQ